MKINIEWQAWSNEDCTTEEQRLLVSTDEGHDLMYCSEDCELDLNINDAGQVLAMVLRDLGFEVTSNR